jgi:hypothetical protein
MPTANPENWQVVHTCLLAEAGVPIMETINSRSCGREALPLGMTVLAALTGFDRTTFVHLDQIPVGGTPVHARARHSSH